MTDKVQKIRSYLADMADADGAVTSVAKAIKRDILPYVDSLLKEPVSKRFVFKAIPRLLEMIEPTDRAKAYTAKLADALEVEGYSTDAKIVRESIKVMNGEKVPMATMDDKPVSEDLEKAAEDWDESLYRSDAFKAGANWQKSQDVKLLFNAKEDGYRLGLATMKQQMMENAVDAKVWNKAYPTKLEIETNTFIQKLNHGDNVKLIIINED